MNLHNAVAMGLFCGLESVDECVCNIEMYSISLFLYADIEEQLKELYAEQDLFLEGKLALDWDALNKANDQAYEDMAACYRTHKGDFDIDHTRGGATVSKTVREGSTPS